MNKMVNKKEMKCKFKQNIEFPHNTDFSYLFIERLTY